MSAFLQGLVLFATAVLTRILFKDHFCILNGIMLNMASCIYKVPQERQSQHAKHLVEWLHEQIQQLICFQQ